MHYHSLFVHPNHIISIEAEFAVPTLFKLLPVVASVTIGLSVLAIYQLAPNLLLSITKTKTAASIYAFFNQRYWVELIVNKFIVTKGLSLGYVFNKQLDRGAIELVGPYGVVTALSSVSGLISNPLFATYCKNVTVAIACPQPQSIISSCLLKNSSGRKLYAEFNLLKCIGPKPTM
ncbi:MAG: hypothetical protein EOP34_04705 [Rickettsiales bacterium]|nr:MAG: hypothetical protein EOP34_04705 [Rickettsiales bacterium]